MVDGCGVLHPRFCGSACQLGVTSGYPAVGVAKNLLAVHGLNLADVRQALSGLGSAAVNGQGQMPVPHLAGAPGPGSGCLASAEAAADDAVNGPREAATEADADADAAATAAAQARGAATARDQHDDHPAAGADAGVRQRHDQLAHTRGQQCQALPLCGASGAVLGAALSVPGSTKAIYVSVGHRLSLHSCVELVKRACRHRIPEPIRQADLRSREWLRRHHDTCMQSSALLPGVAAVPVPGPLLSDSA